MASTFKTSLGDNARQFLENSDLGSDERHAILNCIRDIEAMQTYKPDTASDNELIKTYLGKLQDVAKRVHPVLSILKILPVSEISAFLNIVTGILGAVIELDIASVLEKEYKKILSVPFVEKCQSVCLKIVYCVHYVENMPKEPRDVEQKRFWLQQLATEFPLHDTFSYVLELKETIQKMIEKPTIQRILWCKKDTGKFEKLMLNIELYCSLTTYIELYLLYRMVVQRKYGEDPQPIQAVLERHQKTDEQVLSFIHKPTTKTYRLHYKCNLSDWPNTLRFVERRNLLPERIDDLDNKMFSIRPADDQNKTVCLTGDSGTSYLYLDQNRQTIFKLIPCSSYNTFLIRSYDGQSVMFTSGSRLCVKHTVPDRKSREWYIVKIHQEHDPKTPAYMIWLATKKRVCLGVGYFSWVSSSCFDGPYRYHLWRLEPHGSRFYFVAKEDGTIEICLRGVGQVAELLRSLTCRHLPRAPVGSNPPGGVR